MSDHDDDIPRHAASGGRFTAPQKRAAVIGGVVVMVIAAGLGMSSALSGSNVAAAGCIGRTSREPVSSSSNSGTESSWRRRSGWAGQGDWLRAQAVPTVSQGPVAR